MAHVVDTRPVSLCLPGRSHSHHTRLSRTEVSRPCVGWANRRTFDIVNAMFDEPVAGQRLRFLGDTYLTEIECTVMAVGPGGELLVDDCVMHPQGGGQPADAAWVDDVAVAVLKDHGRGVVLLAPGEPGGSWAVGQRVRARVDREGRLEHAALHTAGHLIEAAGRSLGWDLAGNNHFPGQARIEFTPGVGQVPDSPEQRELAVAQLSTFTATAIAASPTVSADVDDEGHRTVTIEGLHSAPCGGTHVPELSCLTDLELEVKVKKGRIRISYSCEHRPLP